MAKKSLASESIIWNFLLLCAYCLRHFVRRSDDASAQPEKKDSRKQVCRLGTLRAACRICSVVSFSFLRHYRNMSVVPTVRRPSPTVGVGTAIGKHSRRSIGDVTRFCSVVLSVFFLRTRLQRLSLLRLQTYAFLRWRCLSGCSPSCSCFFFPLPDLSMKVHGVQVMHGCGLNSKCTTTVGDIQVVHL